MAQSSFVSANKPALLGLAAVGIGAVVTLAATHLSGGWCPFAGTRCPMTGARGACPATASVEKKKKPIVVTVTGAAGQIGYAILFQIASGKMLGPDQPIELRLLEITAALPLLRGVEMELTDISSPLLHKVVCTDDYKTAFEGCQIALLIGARPRASGMTRADLLKANADIFKKQGKALNDYADRKVKVLVVGNPANTNAKIAMEHAPDLPRTSFTAMTRLDEIRAVAQLAAKAGVNVGAVRNVVVWGNHSETQYPDITFATITKDGQTVPASSLVDQAWAQGEYIQLVQSRGAAIIEAMKKSSAASAANAAIEHVRNWVLGTAPGQWVSMAVPSNGEYGVPAGLVFSFPVTCANGEYSIVPGLEAKIGAFGAGKMETSWKQLEQENAGWREDGAASSS